jgi:hypothetical protein
MYMVGGLVTSYSAEVEVKVEVGGVRSIRPSIRRGLGPFSGWDVNHGMRVKTSTDKSKAAKQEYIKCISTIFPFFRYMKPNETSQDISYSYST